MSPALPRLAGAAAPVLVTGGAGFIGSNLADRLAADGHRVVLYDSLSRPGVERNVEWLRRRYPGRVSLVVGDVRDRADVADHVAGAAAVFHFAAQVAVTTSLTDPRLDFDVNLIGTFNVLDAVRRLDAPVPVVFASTNKVYGDLADIALSDLGDGFVPRDPAHRNGFGEDRPLDFHTPYGCSKGGADQYVLDHARSYGIPAAVMRMSCIYGPRQLGSEDQGWVAHFARSALAGAPISIYGDGHQVRDILLVSDAVDAYVRAWRNIGKVAGRAFNLGGGPDNAVSLSQVLRQIEALLGRRIDIAFYDWRPGDQRYYVSDTSAVSQALRLPPPTSWRDGIAILLAWLQQDSAEARPRRAPVAFAGAAR